MLNLDHIALTVNNLDEAISFYTKIGYTIIDRFVDDGYNWATLSLDSHSLELFELTNNKEENFDHVAYNYDNLDEVLELINSLGYTKDELNIFFGDLKRESFFIKDPAGKSIQLIKKSRLL